MNRRHKKKTQVNHLSEMKYRVKGFKVREKVNALKSGWLLLPQMHRRILTILIPVFVIVWLLPVSQDDTSIEPVTPQRKEVSLNVQSLPTDGEKLQTDSDSWQSYTVQSGDTLSRVFRANELPIADLNALVSIEGQDKPLSRIKQGQIVRFKLSLDGSLDILQLEKGQHSVMFFRLSDGGFGRSK